MIAMPSLAAMYQSKMSAAFSKYLRQMERLGK